MSENTFFLTDCLVPENISSLFSQLNSKISEMDSQFGKILQVHENEFLSAYKIHMLEIQKEIKALKQSITFEEIKRKRDEEILAKERERDWFRNESLRLDKICKDYMKSCEIWKSKAQMLEGDKKILEEKLRKLSQIKEETKKFEPISESPAKKMDLNKSLITESASTLKINRSRADLSYENTINHLQNEVKLYKSMSRKLKSDTNSVLSKRYTLENIFLECIEVAKNDLRKNQDVKNMVYQLTDPNEIFSDPEKRKILYTLLGKPEIVELIRNFLFRSRKSITPSKLSIRSSVSKHGLSSHVFSTPNKKQRLRHLPYSDVSA